MAAETILHSGSFNDYDGNIVTVTFFRHTDLNASPEELFFNNTGGTVQFTIWSRVGNAHLVDPSVDWLNYSLAGTEKIPGTNRYRYTYDIICDPNSGDDRETSLVVDLHEDLPGESISVSVRQGDVEDDE